MDNVFNYFYFRGFMFLYTIIITEMRSNMRSEDNVTFKKIVSSSKMVSRRVKMVLLWKMKKKD